MKMDMKQNMKYYMGLVDEYEVPTGYNCYVWAGRFCVNAIEWCIGSGKKYEILQEDDITNDEIHNIYLYLEKVKDKIIKYLKNILNEYHQTDYSEFKWRILLNFWLTYFLPSMYDKYLRLKKIKKENRIFYTNLYNPECIKVALDQLDFSYLLEDDFGFHRYEYSVLLKEMKDISNIIAVKSDNYERMPLRVNSGELPEYVKNFVDVYRKYKEKTNIQDDIVIQSPYIKFKIYKEIMERKYGKISGYFLDYTYQVRRNMNPNRILDTEWRTRKQHTVYEETDEFVCLIRKIIGYFIPIAYLEEFKCLKTIALNNYKWALRPKVLLYDCEGVAINELFKIYMMNIDVEHILKVDIMHALSYGLGGYSWYLLTEFQMCNECLVCGEIIDNKLSTKFIRMPYINFFRLSDQIDCTNTTIIYVNYSYPQHRSSFGSFEWNWQRYVDGELDFFKMLKKDVISEMKFRLHPYHKNQWNNKEKIKELIPELIFDEKQDFFDSISHAKLVISEIMGAAALEAIGVGKPTVILYNPINQFVELNDNYKDVEDMIRVGIIAETPEKLAALVNNIHDDVESWWNEPKRQQIVRKIREKYTYFPKNAKEIWINRIVSYLDK